MSEQEIKQEADRLAEKHYNIISGGYPYPAFEAMNHALITVNEKIEVFEKVIKSILHEHLYLEKLMIVEELGKLHAVKQELENRL
jgi:hypothetical protein